jgi:predicted RNA-binding Zn ribbon-like protein
MRRARGLRESLDAVLRRLLAGDSFTREWSRVRAEVARAAACAEPVPGGSGVGVEWSWKQVTDLDAPLLPLAHAAADLVGSERVALLRQCGRCRWVFLDRSRNHARRWCDMATCGVAQKVDRQAERRGSTHTARTAPATTTAAATSWTGANPRSAPRRVR